MALTRSQFENEVNYNLGDREDVAQARRLIALNIAQEQIARFHDWRELEQVQTGTLIADTKTLSFPSNPREIYSFRLDLDSSQSRKLIYLPVRFWDRLIPEPEWYATGKPEFYTYYVNKAEMWRIPNDAYKYELRYSAYPADFTAASDVASELLTKDDAIIALATSWLFQSLGEAERAKMWYYRGEAVLKTLRQSEVKRADLTVTGGPHRPSWGEYWKDPFVRSVRPRMG